MLFASCSSYRSVDRTLYARSDSAVVSYLRRQGVPLAYNNNVKPLNGGREKFASLFNDIRQAKSHIHLEYFNFRNDSITDTLVNLLADKVKEGVEVRAMFDAFGNSSNNRPLKDKHLNAMRKKGIEIKKFDPIVFPYINHAFHRDHRKLVVIDGKIAYTGGINVADYYVNGLPEVGPWRDMHVRIEGDAVATFQNIFLNMWNKVNDQEAGDSTYYPEVSDSLLLTFNTAVAVVDRWPRKTPKLMRRTYAEAISAAKEKVEIVNPYFIPTHTVRKAIYKALEDSIDVEIMISSRSDIPFTPDAVYHVVHKMMKKGAKIYLYDGGFNHSKIMMVDDKFSTVGSTNLNSRSLSYDYEINAFIFDEEVTDELNQVFEEYKKESRLLTPEIWKKRSWWRKFCGWLGNLLTPFM